MHTLFFKFHNIFLQFPSNFTDILNESDHFFFGLSHFFVKSLFQHPRINSLEMIRHGNLEKIG